MTEQTEQIEPASPGPPRRRAGPKRIITETPALPVLVTLCNGVAGFAAIHYATRGGLGELTSSNLAISAWLIFAALFFDAMDGRIARMTRQATDFGAQLDSLCDAISFGAAPAILMIHTVSVAQDIKDLNLLLAHPTLGKAVMVVAVVYMCCAVLRLARFNVENAPNLLHHMSFRGLPCPAAAALVAAMVLLFDQLQGIGTGGWWLKITVGVALPALTFAAALLMVSPFSYPHVINRYVVGRKPFGTIVVGVILFVPALAFRRPVLAVCAVLYTASGPVEAIWRKLRPARGEADPDQ